MLFWIVAAALTLAASLAVLVPLAGGRAHARVAGHPDVAVYRDQLAELDRDLARGLIQPAEAEQARAEIGRRLLAADAAAAGGQPADNPVRARNAALRIVPAAAVLAVPLVSWGLYGALGSPDLPSQPLAARLAKDPANSTMDELVARAEAHLASDPSDGKGWEVLAPIYMRMQRFSDSATAWRNAIRLEGATAARWAGLGEALANVSGGIVSAEAEGAFKSALKLEPDNARARFYLAVAAAQEGRADEARQGWREMLATLPADSPWARAAQEALAGIAEAPAGGPAEEDVAAAEAMSPQDRAAMIETMVAGLDERLRRDPHDVEGWMRLIRSYAVLGRTAEARDAAGRGIAALGEASDGGRKVAAFAASLGLKATE